MGVVVALEFGRKKRLAFIAENRRPPEQEKYLGLGAGLINLNDWTGLVLPIRSADHLKPVIAQAWGVINAATARDVIGRLIESGHRAQYQPMYDAMRAGRPVTVDPAYASLVDRAPHNKFTAQEIAACTSLAAWDYDRAAALARQCLAFGYLSEAEVWQVIGTLAPHAKAEFADWRSYAISIMVGRSFCYGGDPFDIMFAMNTLLVSDPELSPWRLYPLHTL